MAEKRVNWYDKQIVDVQDMIAEQTYHVDKEKNNFYKIFNDGIINGLVVSDDSSLASQTTENSNDATLDNTSDKVYQIFKATANNLQKVIVKGKKSGGATGTFRVAIYSLIDPTDSTSAIDGLMSEVNLNIATDLSVTDAEIIADFNATTVSVASALTVDHYYAISISTPVLAGSVTLRYQNSNVYSNGHIRRDISGTVVVYLNEDIYFKIYTCAFSISIGLAYKNGKPIQIETAESKVNFSSTTIGVKNYISLKYVDLNTDYEIPLRLGVLTASRIQDSYEIYISLTQPAYNDANYILLGDITNDGNFPITAITDSRVFLPQHTITSYNEQFEVFGKLKSETLQLDGSTIIVNDDVSDLAYVSKDNYVASAPTVNDDSSLGYNIFSRWIDTSDDNKFYICKDATIGAAVWQLAGGGLSWYEVTGVSQTLRAGYGYIANNGSQVVFTLPATAKIGDTFAVVGKGAGGWKIAQNASQQIIKGLISTTSGVGGYIESIENNSTIELVCITADTIFEVRNVIGSFLTDTALNDSPTLIVKEITGTSATIEMGYCYIANNASQVVFTLPTTANVGDKFSIVGKGAGGWKIAQNASQYQRKSTGVTATGTSGFLISAHKWSCVKEICTETDVGFTVINSEGISYTAGMFQGQTKGYILGGDKTGGGAYTDVIEDLIFSGETSQAIAATLDTAKSNVVNVFSSLKGYTMGGDTGAKTTVIEDLIFADETSQAIFATLSAAKDQAGSGCSTIKGYFLGGYTGAAYVTAIEYLLFADETRSSLAATLDAQKGNLSSLIYSTKMYVCGGMAGAAPFDVIEDLIFADETSQAIVTTLDTIEHSGGPISSSTNGYILGGYTGADVATAIQKFTFSTETATTIVATLNNKKDAQCGISSTIKGWVLSGWNLVATTNVIEDLTYSSETSEAIIAILDESKYASGIGVQY